MSRAEEKKIDIHMKEVEERHEQAEQHITKLEAELEQAQCQRNREVSYFFITVDIFGYWKDRHSALLVIGNSDAWWNNPS